MVGVQQVALVQDGVGDLARVIEMSRRTHLRACGAVLAPLASGTVLPVKPGTSTPTVVNCSGLSVSAQRAVSPNKSLSCSASAGEYARLPGWILIWQRSLIASIRWPVVSLTRSTSDNIGATGGGV